MAESGVSMGVVSTTVFVLSLLLCSLGVESMDTLARPLKFFKGSSNVDARVQLCFGKVDSVNCGDDLLDIASQLKANGPFPADDARLPSIKKRVKTFFARYCNKLKQGGDYYCPINAAATDKRSAVMARLYVTGDKWEIVGDEINQVCISWKLKASHLESISVQTVDPACPFRGTEYAFMRVGIAALLHLNIVGVEDVAKLPCGDDPNAKLRASPFYLLSSSKDQFFYQSMYGQMYRSHDNTPVQAAAALKKKTPKGEARQVLAGVLEAEGDKVKEVIASTWQDVADRLLALCAAHKLTAAGMAALEPLHQAGGPLEPIGTSFRFDIVTVGTSSSDRM